MRKCLWVCGDVCMWQSQVDNTLHWDKEPEGKKAASLVSSLDWCPYSHYAIILHLFAQQIICHSQLSYLLVLFWLLQLPLLSLGLQGKGKLWSVVEMEGCLMHFWKERVIWIWHPWINGNWLFFNLSKFISIWGSFFERDVIIFEITVKGNRAQLAHWELEILLGILWQKIYFHLKNQCELSVD